MEAGRMGIPLGLQLPEPLPVPNPASQAVTLETAEPLQWGLRRLRLQGTRARNRAKSKLAQDFGQ